MWIDVACRIAEAFGKENVKHVMEELKAQGHTKPTVSLFKFKLHHFQARLFAESTAEIMSMQRIEEELAKRQELDEIFVGLGHNASKGTITLAEFCTFLHQVRRSTMHATDADLAAAPARPAPQ